MLAKLLSFLDAGGTIWKCENLHIKDQGVEKDLA